MTAKHTEASITELLRQKYAAPEWAFFAGVPDATGCQKRRTADGIAMSLWPSRGLHLYGFEIKVSRSDWQKELQDPTKADAFARYCHCWQIVAPKGVVKVEELPPSWGLLEVTDKGNLRSKKAVEIAEPREQPGMAFVAALLRAVQKTSDAMAAVERRRGRDEAYEEAKGLAELGLKKTQRLLDRRQKNIDNAREMLQEHFGIDIDRMGWGAWEADLRSQMAVAADLQKVMRGRDSVLKYLQSVVDETARHQRIAQQLVDAIGGLVESAETESN